MSTRVRRTLSAPLVTGASCWPAPRCSPPRPPSAVPTLPSLGCAVNATQSLTNPADVAIPDLAVLPATSTITARPTA